MFEAFAKAVCTRLDIRCVLVLMLFSGMAAAQVPAASAPIARPALVLKIGVGTSVITPTLDMPMAGYYYPRAAEGVHDQLQAKAIVVDDRRQQIVLVACDLVHLDRQIAVDAREAIEKQTGIPGDHVLISAIHSHTGPRLSPEYGKAVSVRIADAVRTAIGNEQPARLMVATEQEPSLPHNRRYLMKDGTIRTNPGFLNPDVVKPVGPIDSRVGVLVAQDERDRPIFTWINYAMHLDTVGGTLISADYPYFLGSLLAKVKGPEMLTVFTIGAAGNINHWDVSRPGPQRGFGEAQRLGEVLAGDVIKAYTHLDPIGKPQVGAERAVIELSPQPYTAKDVEEAKKVLATPPEQGVDFTLDRVKATRVMELQERGGGPIPAEIQVLAVGPVAFVGVPGELFVELGMDIQKRSPFAKTFIVELANDSIGYIPTRESYAQGAYEPTSTRLAPGSGEAIVQKAVELLGKMASAQARP